MGRNLHDAGPKADVFPPLGHSPARAMSNFDHLGGHSHNAGPQTDVSPPSGRSPVRARSNLKNLHDAGHQTDPPLGCSPTIARSDLECVGPDDYQNCPICQEGICKGESEVISLPCCDKPFHKICMWEVLKNQPSSPKCPLCCATFDLDGQAKLIATMTGPSPTGTQICFHLGEVVDLTLSLSKRILSLSIEEVYSKLDRLSTRQLSKKGKGRLRCQLYKRMKIIEQFSGLR